MQTHPQTQATFTMPARPHRFVASDRVEGTLLRRSDGTKIGTIERLMIDKVSGKVAYAVLGFGGFMGVGVKHLPIPWDRIKYAVALDAYEINLSDEELSRAPLFEGDEESDWDYREDVIGNLNSRRGRVEHLEPLGNAQSIRASVPLSEMFGYATDVRSMTQGRATFTMQFDHYSELPANV